MNDNGPMIGHLLSVAVLTVAFLLGYRQWRERRARGSDLSEADARYFARQDVRRLVGAVLMALVAVGISVGSRMVVLKGDREAGRWFIRTWLAVGITLLGLLGLALIDWVATRAYARRHHRALLQDRRQVLREIEDELHRRQRRAATGDGRGPRNGPPEDRPPD